MATTEHSFYEAVWNIVEKHTGFDFNSPILAFEHPVIQSKGEQHSLVVPIPIGVDTTSPFADHSFLFITWYKRRYVIDKVILLDDQESPLVLEINQASVASLKDFCSAMETVNT